MNWDEQIADYVQALKDAGLKRVETDLSKVNPPCYWVTLAALDVVSLAGDLDVQLHVYMVGNQADESRVLPQLRQLLADAIAAGVAPTDAITKVSIALTHSNTQAPALRLPTTI